MIKTAVILAAGLGSRLKEKTKEIPKGFIRVGGKSLIERSVENLFAAGIETIIIGTGHAGEVYQEFAHQYRGIICIKNERYADTGSMFTLYNLREHISGDFVLLESDLIYDKSGLQVLINDPDADLILASGQTFSNDEVFIETDSDGYLLNMSKNQADLKRISAELVGITKLSRQTFQKMCYFAEEQFSNCPKLDYEYVLVGVASHNKIRVKKIEEYVWCEIDDDQHLDRAENIILPKIKEN